MKEKKKELINIRVGRFSWFEYIGTLLAMGVLAALPALMFGADIREYLFPYAIWYVIYWAVIAAVFCLITSRQKRLTFDAPMQKLSKAAKQVAGGDFSVYVKPDHTIDNLDYIDVMFQDFNKMIEALGSLETMKDDFIANVSHEFKTPLSVIQNYASILQNANLSPEQRTEYINTIISSARKLSSLITNILKLNKVENQVIQLDNEPYDLCRQLSDCLISFEEKWLEKDLEMEVDMDDRATIFADASMLEIVWLNLLSNAIKFTESGGMVALRQTSDEESVTVSVSDTGCGIDKKTQERIFEKFYQGDTSHSVEGNGLGLALTRKIIEIVGGDISVSSEPGHGTTFTVKLPLN